jgi:hypothetical protein
MRALFHHLEQYAGSSILTMGVFFLGLFIWTFFGTRLTSIRHLD